MKRIVGNEFGGERPLFASCDLCLEDVTVHAGESALKECRNVEAVGVASRENILSGITTALS